MGEATIDALSNLETATAKDRGIVANLTEANSRLARQLKDRPNELKEDKALLKKERAERKGQRTFNPSPDNYFWSHGYKVEKIAQVRAGTSVRLPRITTWEEAKPTRNDL
jgi:regulator of sirC expression with transglutaminase-like and TPR domain